MLVVGLAVGAVVVYAAAPSLGLGSTKTTTVSGAGTTVTSTTTSVSTQGPITYTIGTIMPLSGGPYGDYAKSFQNSVDLAVSQMNANLTAVGSNIQFKTVHADDLSTAAGALSALQSEFQSSNIQAEVGPLTSAEVLGMVQYATQNHIVLLPGAATGTALIGISPFVFRPGQPGDQFEGTVLAQAVIQTGGKNVVYMYRDDTSESGTFNISSALMIAAGLHVTGISLAPGQTDYSAEVQTAQTDLQQFLSNGGTTKNTVVVIGDGGTEASNVFTHAATTANLGMVRWYGIESLDDPNLLGSAVGSFMAKVNLTITTPQFSNSPQTEYFNSTYTAMFGKVPLPFSNYFYDNAWIAMLSILTAGSGNGQQIIKVLPLVAEHFFGSSSTGIWLVHNDQSIAIYDVLKCGLVSGTPAYVKIGSYNGGTNQLTLS